MFKINLQVDELVLKFDTEVDDALVALNEGRKKAAEIAPTLHALPQYKKLKPNDFTIMVSYNEPQLEMFPGYDHHGQIIMTQVPGTPSLRDLR